MDPRVKFLLTIVVGAALIGFFFWATQAIYKFTGHTITGSAINIDASGAEDLAKCLSEKGVKMYGAYWCGHCQNQEALFGGVEVLKSNNIYVECDSAGENANPQACAAAGVEGYPTWVINNQKYSGEQSLDKLKSLAGC